MMVLRAIGLPAALAALLLSTPAAAVQITHVAADPTVINTDAGDTATITFALSDPADVTLAIHDARGRRVYTKAHKGLASGDQQLTWDGTTSDGRAVTAEAYTFTLTATSEAGKPVTYNPAESTGGDSFQSDRITYDRDTGQLRYVLPGPSRIFLRLGIEKGPMLATIVNGAVRPGGLNTEPWDGWDQSRVIKLADHPRLLFGIRGNRLPRNTLLVKNGEDFPRTPEWSSNPAADAGQAAQWPTSGNPGQCATPEHCRDFRLDLEVLDFERQPVDGRAVAPDQPVIFRVRLSADDEIELESQRFEVSFYADNQLIYENESSYMPYSWTLAPGQLGAGEHYLTVLVIGFGGHFGVATTKLQVSS